MAHKWKKNLLKIPDNILDKIKTIKGENVVAACSVKIRPERLIEGDYKHLDIQIVDGELKYPERVLPRPDTGYYSKYNLYGREIVHRDLPMVPKTFWWESPNFGNWDKGSHDNSRTRDVYQRDWMPPLYLEICVEMMGIDNRNNHAFRFTVDHPISKKDKAFEEKLLFALNLLQENVGNHGVFSTEAKVDDYLKSLYVNWEILPAGELEETVNRIMTGLKRTDTETRKRLTERLKLLEKLQPRNVIFGTSGFQGYVGAQFYDDLVVFENVDYGNAAYVMFDDWEELSKKTRTELLKSSYDFIRIPHTKTWKRRVWRAVKSELAKRAKKN